MTSPLFAVLSLLLLAPTLGAQKKTEPEQAKHVGTPIGLVRVATDAEAKEHVTLLKKHVLPASAKNKRALKKKKRSRRVPKQEVDTGLVTRLEAVEALQEIQHKSFVKPLLQIMEFDPSLAVQTKAARAIQAQPKQQVVPAATKLLSEKKILEKGTMAAPLIKLLGYYGMSQSKWNKLYRRFEHMGPNAQIAVCETIAARKDYEALATLLRNLDPPAPANVDDPSNPPASYWEARWKAWQAFKPSLQSALKVLLGKSFDKSKEALKYIKSEGGIKKLQKKLHG
jgi:hypothetical protein